MGVRGSPGYRTGLPLPGRINGGGTTLALATECLAIAAVGHKALSARRTVFFERQALVLECTQFGHYLRLGRKLASGSNKHDTTHKFRPINSKHAGDTVSVRPSYNDGRGGAGFLDCNSYVACIVVQREALDGPDALSETHPTSPRSSLPFLALRRSSNAAAFSNAPRAAGPTPRRRGSDSGASRSSPRTSRRRPAPAARPGRRSAASPAATMSVRRRFPD
jgi:hypothetical protein